MVSPSVRRDNSRALARGLSLRTGGRTIKARGLSPYRRTNHALFHLYHDMQM